MATLLATVIVPIAAFAGAAGTLLLSAPFQGLAPQDIAHDPTDNTFWVVSYLDGDVKHFDDQFNLLGSFPNPFGGVDGSTGICYYPTNDTFLMVEPRTFQMLEVDRTGAPVGIDVVLGVLPVVNPFGAFLRGMAFLPNGGSGAGSVFVTETVGSVIYQFDLDGGLIDYFVHPDDPDGFPGMGAGAAAGGIDLILSPAGSLVGFDVIGEVGTAPVIHRLTAAGVATGLVISLSESGAAGVGGIIRRPYVDPANGEVYDAIYGTSESTASLFVVDGTLPPIANLLSLSCIATGNDIALTWTLGQPYDSIVIRRNDALLVTLAGTSLGYADNDLADGVYAYEVYGVDGTLETERRNCVDVIGAGQIQALVHLPDLGFAIDLAEDDLGTIYITDIENRILGYDKNLNYLFELTGPFPDMDDELTGIAFRPETQTLLVYNTFTNVIQELDLFGVPVAPPVIAQIPIDPDEEPWIGALAYDPNGNGGDGEIFALELEKGVLYRLARNGAVLSSFVHPEELAHPTPDPSYLDNYMLGLSEVPEIGGGFDEIDLASGYLLDERTTRFIRVNAATGAPTGFQMPIDAMYQARPARYFALHNSTYFGQPVAFTLAIHSNDNVLFRVQRNAPPVRPVDFLECRQPGFDDEVEITFLNHGPYDSIALERNGVLLATLPGSASSYLDTTAAPGRHTYRIIPQLGALAAEARRCDVRVGAGATLQRAFTFPCVSAYQMTRNPVDGKIYIAVNSPAQSSNYFVYDAALNFIGTIPSAAEPPFQVAAFAVRSTPTANEIWSISWQVRAPFLQPQNFFLSVQNLAGGFLQLPTAIDIPGAPVGVALTYPTGLCHDPITDTFWFLERNTDLFWQMSPTGQLLQAVPHPLPPFQPFVFNLGLSIDSERQSLTATTAGPFEHKITRAVEITTTGLPTGEVIALDETPLNPIYGLVRDDHQIWISGSIGSTGLLERLKASDAVAHPIDVTCEESAPQQVTVTWSAPSAYDFVVLRRSGIEIAVVPGSVMSAIDDAVALGPNVYTVAGRVGGAESPQSACALVVTGGGATFIRGDSTGNGIIDIADAIYLLNYLFVFGAAPPCLDAADVNDTGAIDITDPIVLLAYLFAAGPQPPQPFPAPGGDPTGDTLDCTP
ncbi:MAG: dockerin type I repeat-containing protein [Planctomycetota bacterium]